MSKPTIAFFGGEPLGAPALEALLAADIVPGLVVCSPDRPAGRGRKLHQPAVKLLAKAHNISVWQPESYKDETVRENLSNTDWDLFIVVAYNFILPKWLLDMPKKGSLNVHPSLLPALRGPSPIRTAILKNRPQDVGVTIMLLDEKMDHGPIIAQAAYPSPNWPIRGTELDSILAINGGNLLAATVPLWLDGQIEPTTQNHDVATYTKRFLKGDNELQLDPTNLPTGDEAIATLAKIYAWQGIGDTFFKYKNTRVKVKDASLTKDGALQILTVVPENKQVMSFRSYLQSLPA